MGVVMGDRSARTAGSIGNPPHEAFERANPQMVLRSLRHEQGDESRTDRIHVSVIVIGSLSKCNQIAQIRVTPVGFRLYLT
jgi:hypothetical protein